MAVSRTFSAIVAIAFVAVASSLRADVPANAPLGVGRPVSEQEVATEDITVLPSGAGLPAGRGTVQAGRALYAAQCAACHGDRGEGLGDFPALVGGRGSLSLQKPVLTVGSYWPFATTLWDYINRAMPYTDAGTLSSDDVYAVTAYVLYLNGIVSERQVLDRASLSRVRMPNRDGFVEDSPQDFSLRRADPSGQTNIP